VAAAFTAAGCERPAPPAPAKAPSGTVTAPAQGSLKGKIARQGVSRELQQIAMLYVDYHATFGKSPGSLEDLKPSMERDAGKLYQAIKDGYYVVVWKLPTLSSNVVLAYESEADESGQRFVATGDGAVNKLSAADFQAAVPHK
jgi:hypothetical protein